MTKSRSRARRGVTLGDLTQKERAQLLLDFVPGLNAGLRHWVPDAVAEEICTSLRAQLHIVVRTGRAPNI